MKLHKSLLLFGASALLLAACGDDGGSTDEESAEEPEVADIVEDVDASESEEAAEPEDDEEQEVESKEVDTDSNEITLGEPIEFDDFTMTIQSYELSTDMDGNDALVINYDWENTSDETLSPFMTFMLKGFQNNVETSDDLFMVEAVDLGVGQSEVRPGGVIEGATDQVAIDDLSVPLELELDELFSFDNNARIVVLDLSNLE